MHRHQRHHHGDVGRRWHPDVSKVATERLWLTSDGDVVADGHVDAAFLLCAEGDDIPEGCAAPKARKQAEPVEDKAVKAPSEDKAVKRPAKSKK